MQGTYAIDVPKFEMVCSSVGVPEAKLVAIAGFSKRELALTCP
jgi:hypothetical protein